MTHAGKAGQEEQQVQGEQLAVDGGGSELALRRDVLGGDEQDERRARQIADGAEGEHRREEGAQVHPEGGDEVDVLRVADGRAHGAQVGGDGERDDGRYGGAGAHAEEERQGERDERDERDVVGHEHRAREHDVHEHERQAAGGAHAAHEPVANAFEESGSSNPATTVMRQNSRPMVRMSM